MAQLNLSLFEAFCDHGRNCNLHQAGTRWRTNGASRELGLSVLLDPTTHDNINSNDSIIVILGYHHNISVAGQTKDEFFADSSYFTGWKVLIHDPSEFPEVNKKGVFVGPGKEVSIGVSAQTIVSTPEVRRMRPERRKCLLPGEVTTSLYTMKLFKEYKKSSCHFENMAFGLLAEFGCLPYFMPKIPASIMNANPEFKAEGTVICDGYQLKAMAKKIALYSARLTGKDDPMFLKSGNPTPLQCQDECDSTKYTYQVSYADFKDNQDFFLHALLRRGNETLAPINKKFFAEYERYIKDTFEDQLKADDDVLGPPVKSNYSCVRKTVRNKIQKMTFLHVYFDSFGVTKFSKSELFGWQDLVGVFGGIAGLCSGFSLLSAAELIYFFTIRVWARTRNNKPARKTRAMNQN